MACIDFYVDDYLDEASDKALLAEVNDRLARGEWKADLPNIMDTDALHQWTALGLADDLRTAFYARNASRFEMLLRVLEPERRSVPMKVAA